MLPTRSSNRRTSPGGTGRRPQTRRRLWRFLSTLAVLIAALAATADRPQAQFGLPSVVVDTDRWMDQLFNQKPAALETALGRFVLPGSHDAGTYQLLRVPACEGCNNSWRFVDTKAGCEAAVGPELICDDVDEVVDLFGYLWGQTQHLSIAGQLRSGARVFDLRFFRATANDVTRSGGVLTEGVYYIHHGLAGPTLTTVLNDFVDFLADPAHSREVVILNFRFLMEGTDVMGPATLDDFYNRVRANLGRYMAPAIDTSCANDPSCLPTQRFGAAASIGELLAQGHQVIVTGPANGSDVWSNEGADPSYDNGYPLPDDATHPWRSDAEIQTMLEELSSTRGTDPTKLFILGVHVGLDDDGLAIWRSILCPYDPANVGGLCPAVNSDWDEFLSLADVANYTNPKALGALVRMRRDRINAVVADQFDQSFTYEAFKLNGGATRVETIIKSVTELDFHDSLSGPDYFPSFRYPTSYPLTWQVRAQRNIMEQDVPSSGPGGAAQVLPNWPGWKSFPNTDASALISLQIFDAEPAGANSPSAINDSNAPEGEFTRRNDIPIAACLSDFSQCQRAANLLSTEGSGSDSSRVTYTINSCVWSWLNGESVQPSSVCNEPQPSVGIWGASVQEGDSGTQQLRYPIRLSNPFAEPVTVSYGYAIATADTSDYVQAGGSVTFQPGDTLKYATVDVKGDLAIEPDETLTLQLIAPSNVSVMPGFEKAVGTILNDDTDVEMSIADLAQAEGTGGVAATQFLFRVALNPAPTQQVSVHFDVMALTATAGTDFLPLTNGVLTFAPGQAARDIRVDVVPDVSVEPDEQFTVTLSKPVGAYLATASATGTIVNDDHPGTLSLPSNQTAVEGAGQLFSLGTFDDPRAAGPWTLILNWADGTTEQVTLNAPGPLSRTHVYPDNGQYFVSAQVLDRDQVSGGTVKFFIDVANVAPTAVFAAPGPVPEGTPVTFTMSGATDQSLVDRQAGFRYAFACGAGSLATATWANSSAATTVDCTFDDNTTPGTVRARVIDKDDGFTEYTLTPQVRNVAPTALLASNGPVPEGSAATMTFSNPHDPSTADMAAGFHYAFACNGAPLGLATYAATSTQPTVSCVFDQNGQYTVRARIIDKDGGFSEYTTDVAVTNVAPTASLSNNGPIVEGSGATITFSNPFDPSASDTAAGFRYAFSCTGGALTAFTYANSSTQPTTTCAYSNDGVRTVTGRIIDRDGGFTDYSTQVTVSDQPPVVQPPVGVQTAPEGTAFRFNLGTIVDPGPDGPYTVSVSWSDGGPVDIFTASAGPISAVHTFADNRSRFATVIATDRNGVASARINVDFTVTNVLPTITASVSASPVAEGGTTTVTGTITDPGLLDSFTLTVTWGDGASNTYPLASGTTSYTASHAYLDDNPSATPSDVAAVHVVIVDKDGGSGSADTTAQINNTDPVITSLALKDPTGAALGGFVQALSGLPVDLSASFADVGMLDSHAATINWGDGTSSAGTLTESAGAGTLTAGHSWKVPGTYTVSVTVADDDSGRATRDVAVTVVDGAGAACAIEAPVRTLIASLQPGSGAAEEAGELLDAIIGRHDGEADNGACDQLQRRRYTAGVRKMVRAVAEIEELISEGGLTAPQVQTLRDIETRLVLVARWTYNSLVPQEMDRPKLRRAAALAQLAEQATLANQPLVAVDYWWQALRLLKPEDN